MVNPPSAQKYQYWTNPERVRIARRVFRGSKRDQGSWWPDWIGWLDALDAAKVPAKGARIPGKGKLKALEDAPGSYVRMR